MHIRKATQEDVAALAPLIAAFRVALRGYRGIHDAPDIEAARGELIAYLASTTPEYPVYLCTIGTSCAGYLVCRVEAPVVWVESLYVADAHRRMGIASALFAVAEDLAASHHQDTLFNCVHPNNDAMLAFLRDRGYDVLNLIEVRKRHEGEVTRATYRIGNNEFAY